MTTDTFKAAVAIASVQIAAVVIEYPLWKIVIRSECVAARIVKPPKTVVDFSPYITAFARRFVCLRLVNVLDVDTVLVKPFYIFLVCINSDFSLLGTFIKNLIYPW